MRMIGIRQRVRFQLRVAVTRILQVIPLRALLPLRTAFLRSRPGSWRRKTLHGILEVVRHRQIDPDVPVFRLPDNPELSFLRCDSIIAYRTYWMGEEGYEPELLDAWRYLCTRSKNILEFGSNVGYHTVQGAHAAPEARFTAVEPHPFNASVLRENLRLNGCTNVTVIEAAAVGHPTSDTTQLLIPRQDRLGAPAGGFVADGSEVDRLVMTSVTVPVIAAADLLDNTDLIKLDIEGHEFDVLSALEPYILEHKPTLLVEVLSQTPNLRALIGRLADAGYKCLVPARSGLVRVDPRAIPTLDLQATYGTRDLVISTRNDLEPHQLARGRQSTSRP